LQLQCLVLQLLPVLLLLLLPLLQLSGRVEGCQHRSRHCHCDVCGHCYLDGYAEKLEGWGEWELGHWMLLLLQGHLHRQNMGPAGTVSNRGSRSSIPQPSTLG
jgi:hypothetical protein